MTSKGGNGSVYDDDSECLTHSNSRYMSRHYAGTTTTNSLMCIFLLSTLSFQKLVFSKLHSQHVQPISMRNIVSVLVQLNRCTYFNDCSVDVLYT